MKVVGFSFIRNAITFQYPIVEAIKSILPLCGEVVVAVGASNDETRNLVAAISPKVRIVDTVWDESLKQGGHVLADETNKAYRALPADADWCIYIQGDEVLHEDGYPALKAAMQQWKDDDRVDGLLLKYRHFFGSYDYIGAEGHWYRQEIRVVKRRQEIYSYRDAQGFRKGDNKKLRVKPVKAFIHHYGWVQDPKVMKAKFNVKDIINHGKKGAIESQEEVAHIVVPEGYAFSLVNALARYEGTHPSVMQHRIDKMDWIFEWDPARNFLSRKDRFKNFMEKWTGWRPFDYKNYKVV
jgi:glycosyltransferase involved in cell wall biosynthesis